MSGRIPCINPRCRRTAAADKYGSEIVCGKCFRALPEATRSKHRGYWREIRKWDRRITRTGDELKVGKMRRIREQVSDQLVEHWDTAIKAFFLTPEKPAGLDTFLEEIFS